MHASADSLSPRRWRLPSRRTLMMIASILLLLVVLRAVAPLWLRHAINSRLQQVPEYGGHVTDVDLGLWRGAYRIEDIEIVKQNGELAEPFFSADAIDFSVAWRELFRGRIVSDILVERGHLTFVHGDTEEKSQLPADRRWQDVVQDLFPIEITHLELQNGDIRFIDTLREPRVDVAIHEVRALATGLRNRQAEEQDEMPASVIVEGRTIGDGNIRLVLGAAPLAARPHFDVDLRLENVDLTAMNDFLRAYANVDVSRGTFHVYLEAAGRDGAFTGYVKPFFEDLDFENISDRERSLPGKIWESIVAALNSALKNQSRDQLGTRVPFSGNFENTEVGTWTAVVNTVRNGFVQAFSETVEGTIRPEDVVSENTASE